MPLLKALMIDGSLISGTVPKLEYEHLLFHMQVFGFSKVIALAQCCCCSGVAVLLI